MGSIPSMLLANVDSRGCSAAHEIMIATSAVRNLIRESKSHQISSAFKPALRNLFRSGTISKETAEAQAQDKNFVTG